MTKELGPHSRTDRFRTSQFLAKCRAPYTSPSATCAFAMAQIVFQQRKWHWGLGVLELSQAVCILRTSPAMGFRGWDWPEMRLRCLKPLVKRVFRSCSNHGLGLCGAFKEKDIHSRWWKAWRERSNSEAKTTPSDSFSHYCRTTACPGGWRPAQLVYRIHSTKHRPGM